MRGSRAILYVEQLSELTSQLSELEDLRGLVDEAERHARGVPHFASHALLRAAFEVANRAPSLSHSAASRHQAGTQELSALLTTTTKSIGPCLSHSPMDDGLPPEPLQARP